MNERKKRKKKEKKELKNRTIRQKVKCIDRFRMTYKSGHIDLPYEYVSYILRELNYVFCANTVL